MDDYEHTHGLPNRFPENELSHEELTYETKWPPGYWEEYDRLQAEARRVSRDGNAALVMLMSGNFQVRTTGNVSAGGRAHELPVTYGPVARNRHDAWKLFIESLRGGMTEALKDVAGKTLKINTKKVRR